MDDVCDKLSPAIDLTPDIYDFYNPCEGNFRCMVESHPELGDEYLHCAREERLAQANLFGVFFLACVLFYLSFVWLSRGSRNVRNESKS